ncbi:MAG: transporter [Myxococcales bacterium]|nr:transporter [Myxococcales bacterium]
MTDRAPSPWSVLALTSIAVFMVSLDTTVLYVAFEGLRRSFPTDSDADLSWVLNLYTIVFGALLVSAGRLADRVGRRRVFMLGTGLFALASALCGLAPTPDLLLAGRVVQAIGAAMLLPASLALVLAAFPREKRAIAISIWGAVGALAAAVGPAVGSAIVQTLGWRWAFYINVPIGILTIVRSRVRLAESRESVPGPLPNAFGILCAIGAPGLLAFGIIGAGAWGPRSPETLGSIAGSLALFGLLVLDARRSRAPVVDGSLFRDRNYRIATWATLAFSIAFSAMFFGCILFLTRVWSYSILRAGLAMTPGPLAVIPFALIAGRFAAKRGHKNLLVMGGLAYAVAAATLRVFATPDPAYLTLMLPTSIVFGAAIGLVLPSLSGVAVHGLPPDRFALGVAINQAVRQVGSVLGVAFVIGLATRMPLTFPYQPIFLLLIIGGLVTAGLGANVRTAPVPTATTGGTSAAE